MNAVNEEKLKRAEDRRALEAARAQLTLEREKREEEANKRLMGALDIMLRERDMLMGQASKITTEIALVEHEYELVQERRDKETDPTEQMAELISETDFRKKQMLLSLTEAYESIQEQVARAREEESKEAVDEGQEGQGDTEDDNDFIDADVLHGATKAFTELAGRRLKGLFREGKREYTGLVQAQMDSMMEAEEERAIEGSQKQTEGALIPQLQKRIEMLRHQLEAAQSQMKSSQTQSAYDRREFAKAINESKQQIVRLSQKIILLESKKRFEMQVDRDPNMVRDIVSLEEHNLVVAARDELATSNVDLTNQARMLTDELATIQKKLSVAEENAMEANRARSAAEKKTEELIRKDEKTEERFKKLQSTMDEKLAKQKQEAAEEQNDLRHELQTTKENEKGLQSNIKRLETLKDEALAKQAAAEERAGKAAELELQLASSNSRIGELSATIATLEASSAGSQDKIKALDEQVSSLQAQLEQAKAEFEDEKVAFGKQLEASQKEATQAQAQAQTQAQAEAAEAASPQATRSSESLPAGSAGSSDENGAFAPDDGASLGGEDAGQVGASSRVSSCVSSRVGSPDQRPADSRPGSSLSSGIDEVNSAGGEEGLDGATKEGVEEAEEEIEEIEDKALLDRAARDRNSKFESIKRPAGSLDPEGTEYNADSSIKVKVQNQANSKALLQSLKSELEEGSLKNMGTVTQDDFRRLLGLQLGDDSVVQLTTKDYYLNYDGFTDGRMELQRAKMMKEVNNLRVEVCNNYKMEQLASWRTDTDTYLKKLLAFNTIAAVKFFKDGGVFKDILVCHKDNLDACIKMAGGWSTALKGVTEEMDLEADTSIWPTEMRIRVLEFYRHTLLEHIGPISETNLKLKDTVKSLTARVWQLQSRLARKNKKTEEMEEILRTMSTASAPSAANVDADVEFGVDSDEEDENGDTVTARPSPLPLMALESSGVIAPGSPLQKGEGRLKKFSSLSTIVLDSTEKTPGPLVCVDRATSPEPLEQLVSRATSPFPEEQEAAALRALSQMEDRGCSPMIAMSSRTPSRSSSPFREIFVPDRSSSGSPMIKEGSLLRVGSPPRSGNRPRSSSDSNYIVLTSTPNSRSNSRPNSRNDNRPNSRPDSGLTSRYRSMTASSTDGDEEENSSPWCPPDCCCRAAEYCGAAKSRREARKKKLSVFTHSNMPVPHYMTPVTPRSHAGQSSAATRIQSIARGRQSRRQVKERRRRALRRPKTQQEAGLIITAAARGSMARYHVSHYVRPQMQRKKYWTPAPNKVATTTPEDSNDGTMKLVMPGQGLSVHALRDLEITHTNALRKERQEREKERTTQKALGKDVQVKLALDFMNAHMDATKQRRLKEATLAELEKLHANQEMLYQKLDETEKALLGARQAGLMRAENEKEAQEALERAFKAQKRLELARAEDSTRIVELSQQIELLHKIKNELTRTARPKEKEKLQQRTAERLAGVLATQLYGDATPAEGTAQSAAAVKVRETLTELVLDSLQEEEASAADPADGLAQVGATIKDVHGSVKVPALMNWALQATFTDEEKPTTHEAAELLQDRSAGGGGGGASRVSSPDGSGPPSKIRRVYEIQIGPAASAPEPMYVAVGNPAQGVVQDAAVAAPAVEMEDVSTQTPPLERVRAVPDVKSIVSMWKRKSVNFGPRRSMIQQSSATLTAAGAHAAAGTSVASTVTDNNKAAQKDVAASDSTASGKAAATGSDSDSLSPAPIPVESRAVAALVPASTSSMDDEVADAFTKEPATSTPFMPVGTGETEAGEEVIVKRQDSDFVLEATPLDDDSGFPTFAPAEGTRAGALTTTVGGPAGAASLLSAAMGGGSTAIPTNAPAEGVSGATAGVRFLALTGGAVLEICPGFTLATDHLTTHHSLGLSKRVLLCRKVGEAAPDLDSAIQLCPEWMPLPILPKGITPLLVPPEIEIAPGLLYICNSRLADPFSLPGGVLPVRVLQDMVFPKNLRLVQLSQRLAFGSREAQRSIVPKDFALVQCTGAGNIDMNLSGVSLCDGVMIVDPPSGHVLPHGLHFADCSGLVTRISVQESIPGSGGGSGGSGGSVLTNDAPMEDDPASKCNTPVPWKDLENRADVVQVQVQQQSAEERLDAAAEELAGQLEQLLPVGFHAVGTMDTFGASEAGIQDPTVTVLQTPAGVDLTPGQLLVAREPELALPAGCQPVSLAMMPAMLDCDQGTEVVQLEELWDVCPGARLTDKVQLLPRPAGTVCFNIATRFHSVQVPCVILTFLTHFSSSPRTPFSFHCAQ
jgi:hypothetical protein